MEKYRDTLRYAAIIFLCLVNLGMGFSAANTPMVLGGGIGLVYVATAAAKGRGAAAPAKLAQS